MKISVCGKGGCGKSTVCMLLARHALKKGWQVLVVDADVELARKLKSLAGVRLVGVWVGLNSVEDFETRLDEQIESGAITVPEDETRESVIRARIRDIVQEIEFGISCGIFEFTIINQFLF